MSMETEPLGIVSRALPQANYDGSQERLRLGRYGEQYAIVLEPNMAPLAAEGGYFLCNNAGQSGILSSAATGFVATTPACVIYNADSPTNAFAKRVILDYLALMTTVVGSAASGLVNLQMAVYADYGDRYTSGGTDITANIVNASTDASLKASGAKIRFGAITASAATGQVRALVPLRVLRPAVSGTVLDVVGETKLLKFGTVEGIMNGSITVANANFIPVPLPPIILAAGWSLLIYLWQNVGATNVAATYAPDFGWYER